MSEGNYMSLPASRPAAQWREALPRMETYLHALNVASPERQQRILWSILERAAAKQAQNPKENLTTLATNEVFELAEHWFQEIFPAGERVSAGGLISYLAIDAAQKWPEAFLSEDVPADLRLALTKSEVRAAPDLMVSPMVPQPFDNPLGDINLPTALAQLTKDLSPSFVARAVAFVLGAFTLWSGNRLR
jgi:hypothetical protein